MPRLGKFVVLLVAGLAVLTWGGARVVGETTRGWFERDLALRAELAVQSSRRALAAFWRDGERGKVRELLSDVTRDERIMGAAACERDGRVFAKTPGHPGEIQCGEIGRNLEAAAGEPTAWHTTLELATGPVWVSATPIAEEGRSLGFLVLVHDISFVHRRAAQALAYLIAAFAILAAAAALITVVAARLAWRDWRRQLRRVLRGERERPEFTPLLQDVRQLVERMSNEREGGGGPQWSAQRLRRTLERELDGSRVVVVANREPYIHQRSDDGEVRVAHPASGLVTALEPVVRACAGVWIAHGSGSADRDTVDGHDRLRVPPSEESYVLRRVWLSEEEERGYYYGLANEGLWPLCHMAYARPRFRREDWRHYEAVNRRFADAVLAEIDSDDPVVMVQDYHFALAPRFIRERLPRATIITFWHIPWPNAEQFGVCPWRRELLEGLLGSSIMGFHTQLHCNNFLDAIDRYLEARIDRERSAVVLHGDDTLVRPYPISIEWPSRWAEGAPAPEACRASVFAELGLPPETQLVVGVDRLDYTKGIEERLLAFERLLERYAAHRGRLTFAQLAAPSRTEIPRYRELNDDIERLARRINERFGGDGHQPIRLLRAHHEPPTVFRFYRAADACYVSSLHDGMNLVAKEFVAARGDEAGVLVLSQFTGAARELTEALVVNPHDLDEVATALATALAMPPQEQAERLRLMRAYLAEFNVYRWAGRMLTDAGRLRHRGQVLSRLQPPLQVVQGKVG